LTLNSSDKKAHLIFNPGSKNGSNRQVIGAIISRFRKRKWDCTLTTTGCLEDAYSASVNANRENYDCIIAVGGDGTINRVLNGFYDDKGHRTSPAQLGVIHTGTSPDFCKSYGIPTNVPEAIDCILNGKHKAIQVGQITLAKTFMPEYHIRTISINKNFITRYFACCANIGLGASLARYANQGIRTYLGDFAGTFISLIRVLAHYQPSPYTIDIDGQRDSVEKIFNVAVGRSYYIASGIKIKNDLTETDNRFYILTVKNMSLSRIPLCLQTVYSGRIIRNNNYFTLTYGKIINIHGNNDNPEVEFDGDPAGFLPCRIQIAKDALEVFTDINRKT
jgi:YegS/Rv2252/BmrU family lipid kinase